MVTFDSDEFLQLGEVMADQGLQEMLQQRNEKHHFTRFDRTDEWKESLSSPPSLVVGDDYNSRVHY